MFGLSPVELLIIGGIAVLLFGSRLPSVARSMGKSVTEFKKGLHGLEEDLDPSSSSYTANQRRVTRNEVSDHQEVKAPKFEPPTGEPHDEAVKS
jgi:sec-independent protein translocase protein TatA